jgi:zinc transport system ATP-binding protein
MKSSIDTTPDTLLSLDGVSVIRKGERILDNVSLTVSQGEIVTLIGPNGSGKSTLVKAALGLITHDSGEIIRGPAHSMAYVPQRMDIDDTLPITVQRFFQLHARVDEEQQIKALEQTGAAHLLEASLNTLSGGEMRRVLLARAIILKPALLILDEPTAGVDIGGQAALYTLIQELRDSLACGVLLVSHDLHIVMAATDKVVCLNRHLCCSGTPESVSQTPEFALLFGDTMAQELAVYHHNHDHEHGLHGEVREPGPQKHHG